MAKHSREIHAADPSSEEVRLNINQFWNGLFCVGLFSLTFLQYVYNLSNFNTYKENKSLVVPFTRCIANAR